MKSTQLAKKILPNQSNRNQTQSNHKKIKLIHHQLQSSQSEPPPQSQPQVKSQIQSQSTSDSEWPNFNPEKSQFLLNKLIEIIQTELIINQNVILPNPQPLFSTRNPPKKPSCGGGILKTNHVKTLRNLNSWVLDCLVLGLNTIYQKLHFILQTYHHHQNDDSDFDQNRNRTRKLNLSLILICKEDLLSTTASSTEDLISHLPFMIHSINFHSQTNDSKIHLIELPIGSNLILSQLIGIKSCTALAILNDMPGLDCLLKGWLP